MKQSLGRGLDALIPRGVPKSAERPGSVMEVALTDIVPNDSQPRTVFNETLLSELAESIKEKGVIQPIILTKTAESGKYMIIEGERRWRASGLAGKKTIPAVLRDAGTPKERLELALIANAQRADLGPVELARAYARLIDEHGYRQEDVSAVMGRSRSAVANRLRLLALPEAAVMALEDGDITEGHARALLGLEDKLKIVPLLGRIIDGSLSVREAENAVRRANAGERPVKSGPAARPHISGIRAEIEDFFKSKVNIKEKGKGGVIEIKYNSDDELDTIIKKIRGEIC